MKNKQVKIIVSVILLLTIVVFTYNNFTNKNEEIIKNDNIETKESSMISFMLEKTVGSGEYESSNDNTFPSEGYEFNSTLSRCENGGTLSYNDKTKKVVLKTNISDKCYAYFDIKSTQAKDYILAQNEVNEITPDFSTTATTAEGIFTAEDDEGTSYYYRGAVTNNYFYFAGFYWRIVRINGDGTIRLIYQGRNTSDTGSVGTSAWNNTADDNAYVGFKYGTVGADAYALTHTNTNDSSMKMYLDNWYNANLLGYQEYIADSGFCGDRSLASGSGIGTEETYYAAYERLINFRPSYKCVNSNDLYTTSNANKGNKSLIYPIGLLTADEVAYAGGVTTGTSGTANKSFYLYTGTNDKLMTPYAYIGSSVQMFGFASGGVLRRFTGTTNAHQVRPVINIKKDVELTGTGTSTDPYKIGEKITLADYIKSTYGEEETLYYHDEGLTNGAGDNSYRYAGENPNNYVCFGSDASSCPTDNLYRIIGVFGSKIKLIKYDYATSDLLGTDGDYYGSEGTPSASYYKGSMTTIPWYSWSTTLNTWSESQLNTINLNTNFLNNIGSTWAEKIATTTWYIGGGSLTNIAYGANSNAKNTYDYEIGSQKTGTTYSAKIGLMYISEYMYGASPTYWIYPGYTDSNYPDLNGNSGSNYDYRSAKNSNWMYMGFYDWTISRNAEVTSNAVYINSTGRIHDGYVYDYRGVRPTFSLLSSVSYVSGSGTAEDPIRIS